MKMFPIILETDSRFREVIAQIEDYFSMIWTDRYYTPGDFEICVPATPRNISIIKKGYVVGRVTERGLDTSYGIIEYVEKNIDEDGRCRIIARGRFTGAYLYRRVIYGQIIINYGTLKTAIDALLSMNVTSPSQSYRKMTGIMMSDSSISGPSIANMQFTGQNLGEQISELCERYKIGWRMEGSGAPAELVLYEGLDRTVGQRVNKWAVFSDEDGSLLSLNYSEDGTDKVNAVRIAGEGEGAARKMLWCEVDSEDPAEGFDRYEVFVDARDLSTDEGQVSTADYNEMLENRAAESFTDTEYVLEATASFNSLKYKEDVDLGDLCTIKSKALGIEVDARLVEVIESIDEAGRYSAVPTFSI